jgi:hypothetical protein
MGQYKTPTLLTRAGAKLPAAGAFDPTGPAVPCGWASAGTIYIDQQLGGVGSAAQYLVELSPDGEDTVAPRWFIAGIDEGPGVVLVGVGLAVSEFRWIHRLESGTFRVSYPLPYLGGARQLRVRFAEWGNLAAGQEAIVEAFVVLRAEAL